MSAFMWGRLLGQITADAWYGPAEDVSVTCPSCEGTGEGRAIYTSMGRVGATWDGKCTRCKGGGTITRKRRSGGLKDSRN
jgi:DnaJ-class molecular chaperone